MGQDEEKGVTLVDTLGGAQNMTIINESGLYSVILRSDKPQAKPFRARGAPERWRFPKLFRFNGKRFQAAGGEIQKCKSQNANRKNQSQMNISKQSKDALFSFY
jgi:hypothetical protein